MKRIMILCAFIPAQVLSYQHNLTFETQQQEYGAVLINWKTVKDPAMVCHALTGHKSRRPDDIIACATRSGLHCTIYTNRKLDLATLGHEIRHCYEGKWHAENERAE